MTNSKNALVVSKRIRRKAAHQLVSPMAKIAGWPAKITLPPLNIIRKMAISFPQKNGQRSSSSQALMVIPLAAMFYDHSGRPVNIKIHKLLMNNNL
jgi:hypothetical protein